MRFDPATRARLGAHLTQYGTDGRPTAPGLYAVTWAPVPEWERYDVLEVFEAAVDGVPTLRACIIGYPVEPVEFWDVRRHALLVGDET